MSFLLKKIVVVDDDEDNRSAMKDILEFKGFSVVATAINGFDAVEKFYQHAPDVVLMDIMMPDFDGFYGIKNIKNINSDVKIIAITADQSDETKQKLQELKHELIIYKPFDFELLMQMIND